jgi:Domain of unknown function DUF83
MSDLDDKRALYPRVSDIINKQNEVELKRVPIDVLANACLRGTKIHDYCSAWMKKLWVDDIEPEYRPYFDCFVNWARYNIVSIFHTNVRLYDDEYRFTGEFDMIAKLKTEKVALIDIKTSCTKSKAWPVQLAAYDYLCQVNGYKFDKVMNLHLKKTKGVIYEEKEGEKVLISPLQVKAVVTEYEDITTYWRIFHSALACYDYFDRKEKK